MSKERAQGLNESTIAKTNVSDEGVIPLVGMLS